jgi:hypothetical protein
MANQAVFEFFFGGERLAVEGDVGRLGRVLFQVELSISGRLGVL